MLLCEALEIREGRQKNGRCAAFPPLTAAVGGGKPSALPDTTAR